LSRVGFRKVSSILGASGVCLVVAVLLLPACEDPSTQDGVQRQEGAGTKPSIVRVGEESGVMVRIYGPIGGVQWKGPVMIIFDGDTVWRGSPPTYGLRDGEGGIGLWVSVDTGPGSHRIQCVYGGHQVHRHVMIGSTGEYHLGIQIYQGRPPHIMDLRDRSPVIR
jgi:hypothetical protein